MSIIGKTAKLATAIVAPEVAIGGQILGRANSDKAPRNIKSHIPFLIITLVIGLAILGVDRFIHFINWPVIPSVAGSKEVAPANLSPVLVMPTKIINLDQVTNNAYSIDYTSPLTCSTLFGQCVPDSYSNKEIREIGIVPVYVNEQIKPGDIGIKIIQANSNKPGLITYSVHFYPPVLGAPFALEKSIKIDTQIDFNGHTTPIPTDEEIRLTALDQATAAATADATAIPAAKTEAAKRFAEQITNIAQPLLNALSAKKLLNGTYVIKTEIFWDGSNKTVPPSYNS
jgi:hypothetical protein